MVFQWRKWDGSPHWRHECVYLGSDSWGDWVGQPKGWSSVRPGRSGVAKSPNVTLVPARGEGAGFAQAGISSPDFALTVNRDEPDGMRIYIDLGWDVSWSENPELVTGVDMDLDVVRVEGETGTWVDDRDEWAEHAVLFGYPEGVMRQLEALALDLEERVRAQSAPFDNASADIWLDRLAELGLDKEGRAEL